MPLIFLLIIMVVAVIGLIVAGYLYRHRRHGKTVECVISSGCDTIISSRYNLLFGFSNDRLGQVYFGLILILTMINIIIGGAAWLNIVTLLLSLTAGVYAVYLIYIQLRILRHTCTWCLVPTISVLIILLAVFGLLSL